MPPNVTPQKKLTITDCESIAGRTRPWTFRLEFHGQTAQGHRSDKFWYATGRGLAEQIEIGWGAIGAKPQHQLIDWAELRTRVADKLAKGYTYAVTPYIRMSAENFAKVTGQAVTPATPPTTLPVAAPITQPLAPPSDPVSPPAPVPVQPGVKYTNLPPPELLALGEPLSLVRAVKMIRKGTTITGYSALDESGEEVCEMTSKDGREFATKYNLEIVFA